MLTFFNQCYITHGISRGDWSMKITKSHTSSFGWLSVMTKTLQFRDLSRFTAHHTPLSWHFDALRSSSTAAFMSGHTSISFHKPLANVKIFFSDPSWLFLRTIAHSLRTWMFPSRIFKNSIPPDLNLQMGFYNSISTKNTLLFLESGKRKSSFENFTELWIMILYCIIRFEYDNGLYWEHQQPFFLCSSLYPYSVVLVCTNVKRNR